jgi:hypothetical protein
MSHDDQDERIENLKRMCDEGIRELRKCGDVMPDRHFSLAVRKILTGTDVEIDELSLKRGIQNSILGRISYQRLAGGMRASLAPNTADRCLSELLRRLWCLAKRPVACEGLSYFTFYLDCSRPEVGGMSGFSRSDDILLDHAPQIFRR